MNQGEPMQPENQPATASNPTWMTWLGWIITILTALGLIMSGYMKLVKPPEVTDGLKHLQWTESSLLGLAIVEIGCALLYLFPRTAVLGAILLTGYLGGAVATHVRIADLFVGAMIFGVFVWLGLILRDERLRATLPWRRDPSTPATGGFFAALGKIVLTLLVLVGVIVALTEAQPAEYRITRSATFDAPPSKAFEHVNNFHKWEAWSPWAKLDPAAKNTFEGPDAGTGAIFKWAGNNEVGEGNMILTESLPSERIKLKLNFVKPFEDTCDVEFTFKAKGDQTVVTWTMTGERKFLGKAICMVMNMEKMVGGSFEEGLANMKKVVEAKK
jgi:hypothetical protein